MDIWAHAIANAYGQKSLGLSGAISGLGSVPGLLPIETLIASG
ncbi:MAG: hypothetical protein AAGA46_12265 [Cyanobacteria bacterium P01_F01_bin.13]